MGKRILFNSTVLILLAPVPLIAGAAGEETSRSVAFAVPDHGMRAGGNGFQVHARPVFLGCVYSYHECEHLGHGRGFYNHFTRHDHRLCHHGQSYACFGQ